ncbi:MAG: 50S ribosomal protein L32 [Holosporales bacterium]|jgi:large subunit ribosomal protein L32|nr:50S ribosomal protein L32 [Holosporales bacterium]
MLFIFGLLKMAVPKKKTSKSKRDMRRSHDFNTPVNAIVCGNCGKPIVSHNVCKFCNFYNGRNIRAAETVGKV